MTAVSAAEILIAATDTDDRLLACLADCSATFVRTFEEAKRALRERLFKMIVIDLNFDDVRMFDLLQHVRSLAAFDGVPVLCVQGSEPGAGFGAALDRVVRMLGGKALVDLRGEEEARKSALERLCRIAGAELGMGTTQPAGRQSQAGEVAAARERRQALCVLIIDQDVDAAHRLGELVEQAGHDVDFAYDAVTGLEAARRLRPDIVFVDVARTRLDGYALARRLRGEPGLDGSLIAALTAAANEEELQLIRKAGFDHYIVTPAHRQSVQELLGAHRCHPAR